MKDITQVDIHDGKVIKVWKEPGVYTFDFYPLILFRIGENQIEDVLEDFEKIIKKIRNSKNRNI